MYESTQTDDDDERNGKRKTKSAVWYTQRWF